MLKTSGNNVTGGVMTDCIVQGDCREVLRRYPEDFFSACITDPPYNYEFIGRRWDEAEISRRLDRIQDSRTLVKNIPYGSGLAGGVRNPRWYERNRENVREYREWCAGWAGELYRTMRAGAYVLVFNSTRTVGHVQVALEEAGFYARDTLVWRRHAGIPKGYNHAGKLRKDAQDASQWEGWHSCLRNEWEAICMVQKPLLGNYAATLDAAGVGLLNVRLGGDGFQSNILEGLGGSRHRKAAESHCTVKPYDLIEYLVRMTVPETGGHVVVDPFAGTGTTCAAARGCGHRYVGIEISETYCAQARERLAGESE
jgi:site-specific DNA-methyltransferase (adenine-specific)